MLGQVFVTGVFAFQPKGGYTRFLHFKNIESGLCCLTHFWGSVLSLMPSVLCLLVCGILGDKAALPDLVFVWPEENKTARQCSGRCFIFIFFTLKTIKQSSF